MPILKYDLIIADKCGFKQHPEKVLKEYGYSVKKLEGVPIADCVFVEVESVKEPLPDFLSISNFKFTEPAR